MLIVRATKRLLDRIGGPRLVAGEQSTTLLGQWYATALRWRLQVALMVNETTLLPVLMPLAPAATLLARAGDQIATVLSVHGVPGPIIAAEREQMGQWAHGRHRQPQRRRRHERVQLPRRPVARRPR